MAIVAATKPNSTQLKNVAGIAELLYYCSRGPTPARSRSAARLRRATFQRLARAAGAITARGAQYSLIALGPHPQRASAQGCRSLSLGGAALPRFPPAPRSGRGRYYCSRGPISLIALGPTLSAGRLRAAARSRSAA